MPLEAALSELSDHAATGTATPNLSSVIEGDTTGRHYLPTSKIETRVEVFQPRTLVGQIGEEYAVMGELKDALIRNGTERVDPVIVWWSGKSYFCVDGHHRLKAIQNFNTAKVNKAQGDTQRRQAQADALLVPVAILTGPLSEALAWSTRDNGKATITLKKRDKSDWAWKQAVLHWGGAIDGKFVMARRCKDLHVSERLLKLMKSTFVRIATIQPTLHKRDIFELAEMGWDKARALAEGREIAESWDDEKREAEVQKAVSKLITALGRHSFSTTKAEITGEALIRVSERFLELAMGSPEVSEAVMNAAYLQTEVKLGDDEVPSDY